MQVNDICYKTLVNVGTEVLDLHTREDKLQTSIIRKYSSSFNKDYLLNIKGVVLPYVKELFPQTFPAPEPEDTTFSYIKRVAGKEAKGRAFKWGILSVLLSSSTFKSPFDPRGSVTSQSNRAYNSATPKFFAMMRESHGTPYEFWAKNNEWKEFLHKELLFTVEQPLIWDRLNTLELRTEYREKVLEELRIGNPDYMPSQPNKKWSLFKEYPREIREIFAPSPYHISWAGKDAEKWTISTTYHQTFYSIAAGIYLCHPLNKHENHMVGNSLVSDPNLQPQIAEKLVIKKERKQPVEMEYDTLPF